MGLCVGTLCDTTVTYDTRVPCSDSAVMCKLCSQLIPHPAARCWVTFSGQVRLRVDLLRLITGGQGPDSGALKYGCCHRGDGGNRAHREGKWKLALIQINGQVSGESDSDMAHN
ncbi:hypothetical protein SKAU_G00182580 [Synaphobranchus kaupii]|uniref:Uncharacterized protein n=1 Tax=Synaphobranchus kaupii TaxID=118154 RepID=A0A9Q1IVI9_SYNKA|nr:hypothetical protein SKAU_G00182580 [Synaphobranchus kaupii]